MVSTAVYDMGLLLIALTVNYFTFINPCVLATYIKIMSHCCVKWRYNMFRNATLWFQLLNHLELIQNYLKVLVYSVK